MSERLDVKKTYKLVVKGAFVRSESGRSYEVRSAAGDFVANVAQASRKDLRDAVLAARAAQGAWWSTTAYNRGQILYRWAEMAESRSTELAEQVQLADAVSARAARQLVARSIDRLVWYAGWTDKLTQVMGGANPVAGPFFNFSLPVPSGVIGVVAPAVASLEGWVDTVVAPICAGNTVVVLANEARPTPALVLAECSVTSDMPGGVLNLLTGSAAELAPHLASHEDVDGLDLTGAGDLEEDLARRAAASIKRVYRDRSSEGQDSLRRLTTFLETSTVWHTIGQ
jgi:acyl-CoA reductase-like NAD-dependent aldehyde dehydrogenase